MAHDAPATLTYNDFAKVVTAATGSANINEFVPYTVISVGKKLAEAALVLSFSRTLMHNAITSQNGANFTGIANPINGATIAAASLALLLLSLRVAVNLLAIRAAAARKGAADARFTPEVAACFRADLAGRGLKAVHAALIGLTGLVNGVCVVLLSREVCNDWDAASRTALHHTALVCAFATVALAQTRNALDFVAATQKLVNSAGGIRRLLVMASSTRESSSASTALLYTDDPGPASPDYDLVLVGATARLRMVVAVGVWRAVSLGLVSVGFTALLLGLAAVVPIVPVLAIYLSTTSVGQSIGIMMALSCFKRRYASIEVHYARSRVADAAARSPLSVNANAPSDGDGCSDDGFYRVLQAALARNDAAVAGVVAQLPRSAPVWRVCCRPRTWTDYGTLVDTGCYDLARNVLAP